MKFHDLTVTALQKTTKNAIIVTLQPDDKDVDVFTFTQGQYLTFKKDFDDVEIRRCYSICSGTESGELQVAIKRVDGGAFSTWANSELKVGDTLTCLPPLGKFYSAPSTDKKPHYLLLASGSGITPVLSILTTGLAKEPDARFTLVFGNSNPNTIMFREQLEDLKNNYLGRFSLLHILTDDAQGIELFHGRIDANKCADLFNQWIDVASMSQAYVCGPEPMMQAVQQSLIEHHIPREHIHLELFTGSQPGQLKQRIRSTAGAQKDTHGKVTLGGETRTVELTQSTSLLDAALNNNIDAPFACRAGVCSTCIAKVIEGEVEMVVNHALQDDEVNQGFVLTCQCYALSETVVWDYDQAGH